MFIYKLLNFYLPPNTSPSTPLLVERGVLDTYYHYFYSLENLTSAKSPFRGI
jgi:hypothetical protein